ncbi:Ankyrin/F-box protein [Pseudocowpox virus]|uniref:Ankyrin/F-box protein n=1 Tax=Pseudocowpox virus TaxID=129726 RepID=D3IZD8_9POXV|nr:Ankyrin/F-box protein [Pseudocowpox virus]
MDEEFERAEREAAGALYLYLEAEERPDVERMARLLRAGADVNFVGPHGYAPLHMLMRCNPVELDAVRLLLAAGADVNAASLCGFTALHSYMCFGTVTPDTLRALMRHGARVGDLERNLNALLEYFNRDGFMGGAEAAVVALLVERGARVNAKDDLGRTPLHLYLSGFFVAAPVALALIALGADPNARDAYGRTPLHAFLRSRDVDPATLRALIAAGADPLARDIIRRTALHYHCESFKTRAAVIETLVAAGCDPAGTDLLDNTALHSMAMGSSCRASLMRPLLAAGVSVNARNARLQTPLHLAAVFNPPACARLLAAGADPAIADLDENTPLLGMVRHNCARALRAALPLAPDALVAGAVNRVNARTPSAATRECVMALALRGALDLLSAESARVHAAAIRACEAEVALLRRTRLGAPTTTLFALLTARPNTLVSAKAARRSMAEVCVYRAALAARMERVRRKSALVERLAALVCPCALPPELVTRILVLLTTDELACVMRR